MTMLYEDILRLPHPTSLRHPRMSRGNRAAQFAAFAALSGYDDVIRETARLTDARITPSESELDSLDRTLQLILTLIDYHPAVQITLFQPDPQKPSGSYTTLTGNVKKYNDSTKTLILTDNTPLPLSNILTLDLL